MRTKHTFRLPPELARQLADYAGRKRLHQAFVVETALTSFLSPDNSESVLQNTPDSAAVLTLDGVDVRALGSESQTAQFELNLDLSETAAGLAGTLSYAAQLFDRPT